MTPSTSAALSRVAPSATMAITQQARNMTAQGLDVISLSVGEPDFDTPEFIREAAAKAMQDGKTRYTNVDGIPELKQAVCDKFRRDNGLNYQADQINISPVSYTHLTLPTTPYV